MVLQTSADFLDVSYSHGTSCWRLESVTSGEREIDGILIADPFLVRENVTE